MLKALKPKPDDPNFLELIQKYDIIILTETCKADTLKINIEGSWDYSQVCPKHENAIGILGALQSLQKSYKIWSEISGGYRSIPLVSVSEVLIPV